MLTKEFIHIHIPRTGGQKIRDLVSVSGRFGIMDWRKTHMTLEEARKRLSGHVGEEAAARALSFCFVRNPWDWYVSRYFFRKQRDRVPDEEIVPADDCGDGPGGFRRHMEILKKAIDTGTYVMTDEGVPASTRTYNPKTLSEWHYGLVGGGTDMVGRFESFVPELARILSACQSELDHDQIVHLAGRRINASRHGNCRDYYDDETRGWVEEWDGRYIEEFGYGF